MRTAIGQFREQYGHWPTGLALGGETHEAIKHNLTPLGYTTLARKLVLSTQIKHHLILPYDGDGNQFDYATDEVSSGSNPVEVAEVDGWIWGVPLDGN